VLRADQDATGTERLLLYRERDDGRPVGGDLLGVGVDRPHRIHVGADLAPDVGFGRTQLSLTTMRWVSG
jgi:hypothetical protein